MVPATASTKADAAVGSMPRNVQAVDDHEGGNSADADAMPNNPTQKLPDTVSAAVPDDATVVAPNLATKTDGTTVDLKTGAKVTDPKAVGTKDQQPDPLDKTDGKRFIPVEASEVKKAVRSNGGDTDAQAQSQASHPSVHNTALQNNQYGAYWGSYNGTPAFFEAGGKLFAQQAKGVIDVSEHQGTINWQAVKNAGVDGAIIRIAYGWDNNFDAQALRNISECKRLGIPFGIYLYSYAYDNAGATEEGRDLVRKLGQAGVRAQDLSYPVFYDLEKWSWTGYAPPSNPQSYDGIVNSWYSQLQAGGYNNLSVYSYTYYLNTALNSNNIHAKTRWVASYGARTGFGYSTNERGWQYADNGSISGIGGYVDLNVFGNANYSGSWAWGADTDPTGMDLNKLGTKVSDLPNGDYYIISVYDNRVVDVAWASSSNGAHLDIWPFNGQINQKFILKSLGSGKYNIGTSYGKVIDASGPSSNNGTPLIQFGSNGQTNQQWTVYRNNNGICYIASVYAGNKNKVWDITGGSSAAGTNLELWMANGGANQQFRLVPTNDYEPGKNGWVTKGNETYWFDNGIKARSKEVYDPAGKAWYWMNGDGKIAKGWQTLPDGRKVYYDKKSGAMLHGEQHLDGVWRYFKDDGSMAVNQDVHVSSNGGKWVRYDEQGKMVKGEDHRFGAWYLFDQVTGAMVHGWKHIASNGGKWVYYDAITGRMAHGEVCISGNWYYFDDWTGATSYGWRYLSSNGGKWVYYDPVMGWMTKGWRNIDGLMRHFNEQTGAVTN